MRTFAVAAAVLLLLLGCGGSDGDGEAATQVTANTLEVRREDGSRIEFPGTVRAWCGSLGEFGAPDETLNVLGGERPRDGERAQPFWLISRPPEKIESKPQVTLPEEEGSYAIMFVLDDRNNELSSHEEEASGTIEFAEAGCDPGDRVRISIDAVLGSELFGLPNVTIRDEVAVTVGEAPE